jgi:hypothetical protein
VLRLHLLDADGGEVARGGTKLNTECSRTPFASGTGAPDLYVRRAQQPPRPGAPQVVVAVLVDGAAWREASTPATCLVRGARFVGNPRAGEMRRNFVAIMPRAVIEQAANLRIDLSWTP